MGEWGLALVAAGWGTGAALATWAASRSAARAHMRTRIRTLGLAPLAAPARRWVIRLDARSLAEATGRAAQRRWPALAAGLPSRLEAAGMAPALTPAEVIGWQVLALGAGLAIGLLFFGVSVLHGLLAMVGLGSLGWLAPTLWLGRRAAARRREIVRSLPTVFDLLTLSLVGGMGLERALRLVCSRIQGPLADELQRVLADIDLGLPRREAFGRLAGRLALEDVYSLVAAVVQAEELGASLVTAMRGQSRQLRLGRRRLAEAEAYRAPVKMMIPMAVFIIPALMIVLLGPIALQLGQGLGGR